MIPNTSISCMARITIWKYSIGSKPFYLQTLSRTYSARSAESTHPEPQIDTGKVFLGTIHPPNDLENSVKSYLKRHSKEVIVNDGLKLSRYLQNRGRPAAKTKKQTDSQSDSVEVLDEAGRGKKSDEELIQIMLDGSNASTKSDRRENRKKNQQELLRQHNIVRYGDRETTAFAAGRIPACYGVTKRVFNEILVREPNFSPKTVLDFGSGTGTAYWATRSTWEKAPIDYQCVEPSDSMLKLSEDLIRKSHPSQNTPLHGLNFRKFLPMTKITYDLVVAAYTLSEIPFGFQRKQLIKQLWSKTKDFLVVIEHGNNEGFEINLHARNLIAKGLDENLSNDCHAEQDIASVFAPCPHEEVCARSEKESRDHPCNFTQRVGLSYAQQQTGLKRYGYSTERFSYIILKRGQTKESDHPRLLHSIKKHKRHIVCDLCCANGNIEKHVLTKKKHSEIYKRARHQLNWGDMLPLDTNSNKPLYVTKPPTANAEETKE